MKKVTVFWMALLCCACHTMPPATIDSIPSKRPAVLIFMASECPISQKYIETINDLCSAFPNTLFCGVFPERESPQMLRDFVLSHHIQFRVVQDKGSKWQQRLVPTHTPEAFLLSKSDAVLYQGAIDDRYYDLDHQGEPRAYFLHDALTQLRNGLPVSIKNTRPVGCRIEQ